MSTLLLLVHYFGSKEGLFLAALEVTVGPSALFSGLSTLDVREAAELIVGRYLTVLDQETDARRRPRSRAFGGVK